MNKNRKRPQAQKTNRHANPEMHRAMVELRQGSRTQPHRNRARYDRNDFRTQSQKGQW